MTDPINADHGLQPKDLLLPLIAALWACATLVFNVTTECNSIRNQVILGYDGTRAFTPVHREHMMHSDWLPYAILVALVCIGFATLAAWTPRLMPEPTNRRLARPISLFVCAGMAVMALAWIPSALSDWHYMRTTLDSLRVSTPVGPKP